MSSLNVLLVSYVFPPCGGVGVLRAASLARYLPAEGIRLDVVTAGNASAVGTDPTLLDEIPTDVHIHRTLTLDFPFGLKKKIKRLATRTNQNRTGLSKAPSVRKSSFLKSILENILVPDPQVAWLPILTRAARHIVLERNIGLVLITAPHSPTFFWSKD